MWIKKIINNFFLGTIIFFPLLFGITSCNASIEIPDFLEIHASFPSIIFSKVAEEIKETQDLSNSVFSNTGVKISKSLEFSVSNELPDGLNIDKETGSIKGVCKQFVEDFSFNICVNAKINGKELFGLSPTIKLVFIDDNFPQIEIHSQFTDIIGNVDIPIEQTTDLSKCVYTNHGYKITDEIAFKLVQSNNTSEIPEWIDFNTKTGQISGIPQSEVNLKFKIIASINVFGKELTTESSVFIFKTYKKNILPYECYDIQNGIIKGFSKNFNIEKYSYANTLELPSYVTGIEGIGFQNIKYSQLINLDLSKTSIKSIPISTFENCSYIQTISFPNSINSISLSAFYDCRAVTSLDFSKCSSLKKIGDSAFEKCKAIQNILFSESIIQIGLSSFSSCKSLRTVDLSSCSELKILPSGAFNYCDSLSSILLPPSIESIGTACFSGSSITNLDLSNYDKLEKIDNRAFGECFSLKSIKLPSSLKIIFDFCFINDNNLSSIEWSELNDLNISIGYKVFTSISKSGVVSSNGQYTSQQLLNWLQGKDGTGIKGDFPTTGWDTTKAL